MKTENNTAEFSTSTCDVIALKLFEDKLEKLHELYKTQIDVAMKLTDFTDDQVMEMILAVEATIMYNDKQNVVAVQAKKVI